MYRSVNVVEGHQDDGLRIQSTKFCTAFRTAPKPPAFYAQSVKCVYIDDLGLRSIGQQFLPMCANLIELSYGASNYPPRPGILKAILEESSFPKLRRLGIDGAPQSLGLLSGFGLPVLHHITLIEMVDSGQMTWNGLEALHSLKHLLIDVRPQWTDLNRFSSVTADQLLPVINAIIPHLPPDIMHVVFLVPNYLPFLLSWVDCERHLKLNKPRSFRPVIVGQVDRRIFLAVPGQAEELNAKGTTDQHMNEFQTTVHHLVSVSKANPPWYWVRWAERIVQDSEYR